jgi:nucleoside-diphosphate-sugar epimerase
MKCVLVTGASGFIARFMLAPLVARGYEVAQNTWRESHLLAKR